MRRSVPAPSAVGSKSNATSGAAADILTASVDGPAASENPRLPVQK